MTEQIKFLETKFFRPRDIGCNRKPIYDENGNYLRDELKSGFEFDDFSDLKQKLVEILGLNLYDHLYITECGGVINGLCIGYVEQTKTPEELAHIVSKKIIHIKQDSYDEEQKIITDIMKGE